jgi:hypothetical protein
VAIVVPVGLLGHLRRARDVADRNYAEPLDLAGLAAADRPYGVEAVLRDNSGNWLVLVEQKPYTADDFA